MASRRSFLKASAALAFIPLLNVETRSAMAADKVPASDPTAIALKYVEDATTAARVEKMGVAPDQQSCSSCNFYTAASEADGYAPCTIFAGRLVASAGWCSGWTPKA